MERQVGGSSAAAELAGLSYRGGEVAGIGAQEFARRRQHAAAVMRDSGIGALVLTAGSNLAYFTDVHLHPSERLTAAVLSEQGVLSWISPTFEEPRLRLFAGSDAVIHTWQEEEDPFSLLPEAVGGTGDTPVAIDEVTPFWAVDRMARALGAGRCVPATPITSGCRMIKSPAEIAIIRHVMTLTLEVQRRAARILRPGITAEEVRTFINDAHRRLVRADSTFCIVSFGEATAYPHGGSADQVLADGDMILIDTGTTLHGYNSDITRCYMFGEPTAKYRRIWTIEREAQFAAFTAARTGATCESVDTAARACLADHGLSADYDIPGLPHRTGHGLGLDLHEQPYLVRGSTERLRQGMCMSNEPMICLYGEFGVRLEDHFYMDADGPVWFTEPSPSLDRPFADRVTA